MNVFSLTFFFKKKKIEMICPTGHVLCWEIFLTINKWAYLLIASPSININFKRGLLLNLLDNKSKPKHIQEQHAKSQVDVKSWDTREFLGDATTPRISQRHHDPGILGSITSVTVPWCQSWRDFGYLGISSQD